MRKKGLLLLILLCLLLGGLYANSSQPYEKQDLRGYIRHYVDLHWVEKTFGGISFAYGSKQISVKDVGADSFVEFFIRKAAHVLTFTCLPLAFFFCLRNRIQSAVAFPWSGFLSLLCAVFDEFHQSFTPNRTGMLLDVVLDSAGIGLGLLIIVGWLSLIAFRKRTIV